MERIMTIMTVKILGKNGLTVIAIAMLGNLTKNSLKIMTLLIMQIRNL